MRTSNEPAPNAGARSRLRQIAIAAIAHVGYRRYADIHDIVINKGFFGSGLGLEDFRRVESVFLIAQSLLWTAEDGIDIEWWHTWAITRLQHLEVPIPPESTEEGQGVMAA